MISCHKNIVIVACIFALLLSCQSQSSLAQSNSNGGGSSSSVQANADVNSKGLSGSAQAAGSANGASGSLSAGANAATSGGAGSGGGSGSSGGGSEGSASAGASLSISQGSSTPKPEGFLGKIKDVVKSGVDSMSTSKKGDNNQQQQQQQQQQGSASANVSLNSGDNQSQSNSGSGLTQKLGEAAKKAKEIVKEGAKEVRDDVKTVMGLNGTNSNNNSGGSGGSSGGLSASGSVKLGGNSIGGSMQLNANAKVDSNSNSNSNSKSDGPISKLLQKVGNKAAEFTDSLGAGNSSGNGGGSNNGGNSNNVGGSASANAQVKVNMNGGNAPENENRSLTVNLADKVHEFAKAPVEAVMKPFDKALGFDRDPLIKMYDDSHDIMRKPLSVVAKPVDSVLSGAFKTSEEAKQEQERFMTEQERRDMRLREDYARKEGRSLLGDIVDRMVDLAGKPYEIILKPVDKILGFDKEGQKGPLIKMIDEIYNISRKPIDAVAKPLENILKKMADGGDQTYQVSVRLNTGTTESSDPKLLTRLADGALNIADRVVTKPLEIVMRPLGYDGRAKKNPIVESTHQLKNATKLGVELFTRPVDRIIKEISDIGANKSAAERDADRERKLQEASRLVKVLDKLNQAAQMPWEIVLRPISRVTGYSKEGKREPLLRAWDILHQVIRTPIQIVSKPVEDAILGEQKPSPGGTKANAKAELKLGGKMGVNAQVQIGANGGAAGASSSASHGQSEEGPKKNIFVDGVKKMEKIAVKPFDKLTSPIRKLILGEDEKVGGGANAKASVNLPAGNVQVKAQMGASKSNEPDKIMKNLEKMNNVLLKPFEVVSQPIADMLDGKKSTDTKAQAQGSAQLNGQQGQNKAAASASAQLNGGNSNNGSGASGSASGSASGVMGAGGGQLNMSASAAAQAKQTNSNNNNGSGAGNNNSGSSNNGQNNMSASGSASAQLKKN